jgi:large subunit ribosomal protein L4
LFLILASEDVNLPIITSRKLPHLSPYESPRQAWVENLDTLEEKKLGILDLHPDVFGVMPRIDVIQENVKWQRMYKFVVS